MLDLTKENFAQEVLEAEGKVFVDFYGDGCVPCAALMPSEQPYAAEYGDQRTLTTLNTTTDRRLALYQKILGLPVMAIYENGAMIDSVVKEEATADSILEMIKRHI